VLVSTLSRMSYPTNDKRVIRDRKGERTGDDAAIYTSLPPDCVLDEDSIIPPVRVITEGDADCPQVSATCRVNFRATSIVRDDVPVMNIGVVENWLQSPLRERYLNENQKTQNSREAETTKATKTAPPPPPLLSWSWLCCECDQVGGAMRFPLAMDVERCADCDHLRCDACCTESKGIV
jgi:hypothetical protein